MRKVGIAILLSLFATMAMAQSTPQFQKYWEKLCGVKTSVDDVRTMAIWRAGNLFVTMDRAAGANALPIYNLNSGQPWIKQEYVKMSGDVVSIPAGTYNIVDGDFTDDGKLIVCSLSLNTTPLKVYIWDDLTTGPRVIYDSGAAWVGYRLGDAVDVAGSAADNSAVVLITGNSTTSVPLKLTTADNGRTWAATNLSGVVQAQEIEQVTPGGDFWATRYSSSVPIQRYNSAGVSYGAGAGNQILNGGNAFAGIAIDTAYDRIYTMGINGSTLLGQNVLRVYQMSTGALIESFSSDLLDLAGAAGLSPANGSGSCELVVTPGGGHFIYALSERNGVARYSYGTQVSVPVEYATPQAAIAAFNPLGALDPAIYTTVTLPLAIAIDPAAGPYDTVMNLNPAIGTGGAIQGDLVLKSLVPGTRPVIKLQLSPGSGAAAETDGLQVHQEVNGVILKDLLFCPSTTNPLQDDLLKFDENSANAVKNWFEFWNVVVTDIKVGGDPMVTSKEEALVGPHPPRGSLMASGDQLIKVWNDTGERLGCVADNLVVYGGASYGCGIIMSGSLDEEVYVNNSLFAWNDYAGLEIGYRAGTGTKYSRVTGTDAGAGPLNCTASIQNEWHGLYFYANRDGVCKVDNYLCYVDAAGDVATPGDARAISGSGWVDLQVRDSILIARNACIVDGLTNYPETPAIWERVTLHNNMSNNTLFQISATPSAALTVKDCIISGSGTKFANSGDTAATVTLVNTALVSEGPDAITAPGAVTTSTGLVLADPMYVQKTNPALNTLLDVANRAYAGKSSAAGFLVGGADPAAMLFDSGPGWKIASGSGVYTLYDAPLGVTVSNSDIINTMTGTLSGNGFHPATVGGVANLTNGEYDANGLTVIGADTDGSSQPSFTVEYDFVAGGEQADITGVRIFSGHDGDGTRVFINASVEVDTGSGYAPLATITTGAFGLTKPNASSVAYAEWAGTVNDVQKIRLTFENVSHSSTGFFQDPADNVTNPPQNYPNQGSIIKEIDVFGTKEPAASVMDWTLY